MSQLKYRADIDGLRALAVLGVILYHAFPHLLPGGFIGVDIFFVISGYLISGILYRGVQDGSFSFRDFYARRIRRLFPSLIMLTILCLLYGWIVMFPEEFRLLGKRVAWGMIFSQNFSYWQDVGYFDISAQLKPLLHLWSLAVEEQFYIFFPPLMILIWKRKWPYAAIIGVLLAVSFVLNLVMASQNQSSDFFMTPYRCWEFLGGTLLAWHHFGKDHAEGRQGSWMAMIGILLLILGMLLLDATKPYPGWRALVPFCGSLLVIGAGPSAWMNRQVLSLRPVVWIGLISYPLYLFHWPPLSFLHLLRGFTPSIMATLSALVIGFIIAIVVYQFVEKPLRRNASPLVVLWLTIVFMLCGVIGALVWKGWIPSKALPAPLELIRSACRDNDMMEGLPKSGLILINRIGGSGSQTLVLGDSNAQMYIPRIRRLLDKADSGGRGAILVTLGGSPPLPEVTNPHNKNSALLLPTFQDILAKDRRVDRIVIASLWSQYFSESQGYLYHGDPLSHPEAQVKALAAFSKMIRELVDSGKPVSVVLNIPFGAPFDPNGLISRDFLGRCRQTVNPPLKSDYLKQEGPIREQIASAARAAGAKVEDPLDFLCDSDQCKILDAGVPIRFDHGHLRPGFVREKAVWIDDSFLLQKADK